MRYASDFMFSSQAAAVACDDPVEVPGGMSESALSDDETGHGDYFQVEKLVACRNSRGMAIDGYKLNMRLYKVRWAGYGEGDDTWEPLQTLHSVKGLVQAYERAERAKGDTEKKQAGKRKKREAAGGDDEDEAEAKKSKTLLWPKLQH